MLFRALRRRLACLARLPSRKAWREALIAAVLFALIAVSLAQASGLVAGLEWPGFAPAFLLFGRVLVVPALLEEVLFRALLNPPPGWVALGARVGWGALSLFAYVVAHPLSAWLFRPSAVDVFTSPIFLFLVSLLGFLCLTLYLRSGSLWSSVLLHAVVVTLWAFGGGLEQLEG